MAAQLLPDLFVFCFFCFLVVEGKEGEGEFVLADGIHPS